MELRIILPSAIADFISPYRVRVRVRVKERVRGLEGSV
jgi:hypothetical protein